MVLGLLEEEDRDEDEDADAEGCGWWLWVVVGRRSDKKPAALVLVEKALFSGYLRSKSV